MLNLTWIKNPDHVSYCKENEVLPRLARELGIADLAQQVEEFRTHPTAEGVNLKGKKRTTLKLFIPNLTFRSRWRWGRTCGSIWGSCAPPTVCLPLGRQKRIDATGRRYGYGRTKKILGGQALRFLYQQGVEYYPCHPVPEGTEFNCLFCYCPLYMLGRKCGGNFTYLESGVKDCSKCLVPHRRENYGFIADSFQKIAGEMAEREKKEGQ